MRKSLSIMLCIMLLIVMMTGCDIVNHVKDNTNLDELGEKVEDLKEAGKAVTDALGKVEDLVGNIDYEAMKDNLKETMELIDKASEALPIRDPAIERDYKTEYDQLIQWFDGLRSEYMVDKEGHAVTFELLKVEDVTDAFEEAYVGECFYHYDARYFKIYYVVIDKDAEGELVDTRQLAHMENGMSVEVFNADGTWVVTPMSDKIVESCIN